MRDLSRQEVPLFFVTVQVEIFFTTKSFHSFVLLVTFVERIRDIL